MLLSLEGIYDAAFQGYWSDNHVFQVTMDPKFRQDIPKNSEPPSLFLCLQSCCGMCHAPGQHPA